MFDILCIVMLYYMFIINLLGIKMIFFFKLFLVICVVNLSISFIKRIQGKTTKMTDDAPPFVVRLLKILVCIASPMGCLIFTAFASWKIQVVFGVFFLALIAVAWLLKASRIKALFLLLLSVCYGIVLAKWYQLNWVEWGFGNNNFSESLGIFSSSVMLLLPIYTLTKHCAKREE